MEVGDDGSGLTKELVEAGLRQRIIAGANGCRGESGNINKSEMEPGRSCLRISIALTASRVAISPAATKR